MDHTSLRARILHALSEIELAFGLWALIFVAGTYIVAGFESATSFYLGMGFHEPIFVFAVLLVASTRPVIFVSALALQLIARVFTRLLRMKAVYVEFICLLSLGPLLGSLITEPAAITVTALLLKRMIKSQVAGTASANNDEKFNYLLLALLFVNVSIGGSLTHFAAPPILMVARPWGWTTPDVFMFFGWRAMLAVFTNAILACIFFRRQIETNLQNLAEAPLKENPIPVFVILLHLFVLTLVVLFAHQPELALAALAFFLVVWFSTRSFQNPLKFREALLVGFFLGGVMVFGPFQSWWLGPLLKSIDGRALFLLSTGLTAVVDNAALTYLGSLVPDLSEISKHFLVAGAIAGGGLTVIANAPNPVGLSLLQSCFPSGFRALHLLIAASAPTLVALLFFAL